MSGPKLVVLSPPKELEFDLKKQESSEQKLTITNVHSGAISFKVKTTENPKPAKPPINFARPLHI